MNKSEFNLYLVVIAEQYLENNPERLTNGEKNQFRQGLKEYLDNSSKTIDDMVYDFLVDTGLVKFSRREESFGSFVNKHFSIIRFKKVLDVGAGRMCRLSQYLSKFGYEMYALDPNIRLTQNEAKRAGIKSISQNKFVCDEYSKRGIGTDIGDYDLLVGLEPCDATEHIIRQALKYDKEFAVALCGAPHNALNGKTFKSYEDWYDYLAKISREVKIQKEKNFYYATNFEK